MEVHHHSNTERKKWTHYFWEFFMLFLAVTLGFFVENQREHMAEHRHARQYASTMISDLEEDTAKLAPVTKNLLFATSMLDTFRIVLNGNVTEKHSGKIYWYGFAGGFNYDFVSSDATLEQLKHSGTLRYFTDTSISRRISHYDFLMRFIASRLVTDQQLLVETRKIRARIFDNAYVASANDLFRMISKNPANKEKLDSFLQTDPPLLDNDRVLMNEYLELSRTRQQVWSNLISTQLDALHTATELIHSLKKEYGLD